MIPAHPKPSQVKQPKPYYREFAGGRIVYDLTTKRGREEYSGNVRKMHKRQSGKCGLQISPQCKAKQGRLSLEYAQFDHDNGRGSGGSKRDDRIEKINPETGEVEPINHAVCPWCNILKGSRPRSVVLAELVP